MLQELKHSCSVWIGKLAWIILVGLSAILGILLARFGVPAALLLGPMLAGIAIFAGGAKLQVPPRAFAVAQGLIGCMIAKIVPISSNSCRVRYLPPTGSTPLSTAHDFCGLDSS